MVLQAGETDSLKYREGLRAQAGSDYFCVMQIEKSSHTVFTALEDGTAVLLNLDTLFYYSLNRTGAALWNQIETGQSVTDADLVQAICERFDVDQDSAQQSIREFLERLEQFKMIRIQ